MRRCFKCKKIIKENPFMYAIDIPYINLWFHKKCYKQVENIMKEYLLENYARLEDALREKYKTK